MPPTGVSRSWNQVIASFPEPHLLQTWEWSQFKSQFGWKPFYMLWSQAGEPTVKQSYDVPLAFSQEPPEAAALVLQRTIPIRGFAAALRVIYVPKGPFLRDWSRAELRQRVFSGLRDLGRRQGAIFLKIDPDVYIGKGSSGTGENQTDLLGQQVVDDLKAHGWKFSTEQVQFRNTVMIDLSLSEDELLARMRQKTRYNVRLAQRKGVTVRSGSIEDLGLLYRMYAETSLRDGFVIRDESYYRLLWETFLLIHRKVRSTILSVDHRSNRRSGCGLVGVLFFRRAWYLFGMSRDAHREKMPNHLLQWEAIRQAKATGCRVYDLWGAPDEFVESDPLWGVYRFKEGLGGEVVRHLGAWDLPLRPFYYRLYTQILPRLLDIMRRRGKSQTERMASL
jgi:lipid II:glycine glycyltransferase (peptidoglycan interpeptide bridge formation enzyme)